METRRFGSSLVRHFSVFGVVLGAACVSGCASHDDANGATAEAEEALRTTYGDFNTTLAEGDLDRWYAARASLIKGFDNICGDTICSGDFSNLTTLELSCSSTATAKKMKDCLWVLGGSIGYVDGRTGSFTTEARVFECHIPVAGTAPRMLDTLAAAGDDALNAPVANGASFYDGLTKCFEGVVGSPPPTSTGTTYRDFEDYLWEVDNDQAVAWLGVRRTLAKSFDDVCGDTFCEGDYSDIGLVDVSCAARATTGRVKSCRLAFGKVNAQVDARGRFTSDSTTTTCDVPVNATRADFMRALSGSDPLRAPLPGRTTSIYDALVDCL